MLKHTTSRLSGVLTLVAATLVINGWACSSSKPAKKAAGGAAEEEEECEESTSTKKSTSKLTDDGFDLTQTGTGSNSSTSSGTGTGTGSGTGTGTGDEPTYYGKVKTLIDKSCAKSGCHNKGGTDPDLTTYANVKKEKEDFFRTLDPDDDKAMPVGSPLKAADLKLLEDWKEAEFPEGEAPDDEEGEETGSATNTKTSTSTSKSTSKCSTSKKSSEEEEEEEE